LILIFTEKIVGIAFGDVRRFRIRLIFAKKKAILELYQTQAVNQSFLPPQLLSIYNFGLPNPI
jgi:hypothetical protein